MSTDSRNVPEGCLFVALRGERFDGNAYAADALERGAAYAVVDDRRVARDDRYVVVDDTLVALQNLAAHHRKAIGATIVAITGTNGKTTTKELVARVLSRRFRVAATEGNLNNHIGVPLTLLRMREGELGVVEMGASAVGEIRALCDIAAPDYGLVTNVGRAHLDGFGGADGVRAAKGELYDYLEAHGGTALVRAADPQLMAMAHERPALKIREYHDVEGFETSLEGAYNVANISAAVAVGRELGVAEDDIRAAVASYMPSNNRSQKICTEHNTLIMDCYNANPSSMRAALEAFRGDTVILGDMAELGEYSAQEHEQIVALLLSRGIRMAYLVGRCFAEAVRNMPDTPEVTIETFGDTTTLVDFLKTTPLRGRTILIKGSRTMALERVREVL